MWLVRPLEVVLRILHPGMNDSFYRALMDDADSASSEELESASELLSRLR